MLTLPWVGLVAASALVVPAAPFPLVAPSHAAPLMCQGEEATIVGPNSPYNKTVGTEGDDVIVATLGAASTTVDALGGNDTICLVGGAVPDPRQTGSYIRSGDGDDSVLNELTSDLRPSVFLGQGHDHYVGNDFDEYVDTGFNSIDDEVDVVETFAGDDNVQSGAGPGVENHDLISTGPGHDFVYYLNPSGEMVDNGTGADTIELATFGPHEWTVDNVEGYLASGDQTMLTWTNIDTFRINQAREDSLTFRGAETDETLLVASEGVDGISRGASLSMGGGEDSVELRRYLPAELDMGAGADTLTYNVMSGGCRLATITMDSSATCTTSASQDVVTSLGGIERLEVRARDRLDVRGTPRRDVIIASGPVLRIHSGAGPDRVQSVKTENSKIWGGSGDDILTGSEGSLVLRGGRGNDVLRGGPASDRLYGDSGRDRADGRLGRDTCVAEVRRQCELPR